MAASVLLLFPPTTLAAGGNELSGGVVDPTEGTVDTVFVFSVIYTSSQGRPAASVLARVAGLTVELSLVAGSDVDGTYRGSSSLPAGTWPVTFEADATQGRDPMLPGPTVIVHAAAAASPAPPAPTPVPAPAAPAPQPPAVAPVAGVPPAAPTDPAATEAAIQVAVTGGVISSDPLDKNSSVTGPMPTEGQAWPWMTMGIGLAGILGMAGAGYVVVGRRRRHISDAPFAAVPPPPVTPILRADAPEPPRPLRRPRADWELYSGLENEPIGTVGLASNFGGARTDLPIHGTPRPAGE